MQENPVEITDLMSSILRLTTNYIQSPHETQIMTLLHLFDLIQQHPSYEKNNGVKVAIEQSKMFWLTKVKNAHENFSYCKNSKNHSIH